MGAVSEDRAVFQRFGLYPRLSLRRSRGPQAAMATSSIVAPITSGLRPFSSRRSLRG